MFSGVNQFLKSPVEVDSNWEDSVIVGLEDVECQVVQMKMPHLR